MDIRVEKAPQHMVGREEEVKLIDTIEREWRMFLPIHT